MKGGNKQEDAWITPFVKQFSGIGFAVSASPPRPLPPDAGLRAARVSSFLS